MTTEEFKELIILMLEEAQEDLTKQVPEKLEEEIPTGEEGTEI